MVLILVALAKLLDWNPNVWFSDDLPEEVIENTTEPAVILDSIVSNTNTAAPAKIESKRQVTLPPPSANSASIYIFGEHGLDNALGNQLAKTFFKDYSIKAQAGFKKDELLLGNLSSAANTELVCIGAVDYSYSTNQFNMITCRVNLNFDTYNRITGNKVMNLSGAFNEGGPGYSNAEAKTVALQKIHP